MVILTMAQVEVVRGDTVQLLTTLCSLLVTMALLWVQVVVMMEQVVPQYGTVVTQAPQVPLLLQVVLVDLVFPVVHPMTPATRPMVQVVEVVETMKVPVRTLVVHQAPMETTVVTRHRVAPDHSPLVVVEVLVQQVVIVNVRHL